MRNKLAKTENSLYKYRGVRCLNCDHPLDISDKFCPQCAQKNSTKKPAIFDYIEEFFGSMISYDSKLAKTLSAMLFRPGTITADYLLGKRIRYTNPFRFFLSINIVYFLLLGLSDKLPETDINLNNFDNEKNISTLHEALVQSNKLSDKEKEESRQLLEKIKSNIEKEQQKKQYLIQIPYDSLKKIDSLKNKDLLTDYYRILLEKEDQISFEEVHQKYKVPNNWYNRNMYRLAKGAKKALENPNDVIRIMVARLPFIIFIFIPIFALFVWFLFATVKINYTDHLIFCFHTQSLFTILLIFGVLIDLIFKINSLPFILFLFCVYLYKAIRNFYKQKRWLTIFKFLTLNTIFITLASVISVFSLIGSIILY
ncbi:MAG: DUF3667 domain-containing protein [Flavobacteriaceae bacterium]|nr:DUF3667 domain-containing protein [Flavobacteriaceae bacterium]